MTDTLADEVGAFVPGPRLDVPGAAGGPLAGLDFAAKDLFDVAGHPTTYGNPDWARTHPPAAGTAPCVSALLEAGVRWALVSEGEGGSVLGDDSGGRWRVEPPRVEAVYPIGSGDVMAAGLLFVLSRGGSVPDAAVYGTACAAANVLTAMSGEVRPDDVAALLGRVRLKRLA